MVLVKRGIRERIGKRGESFFHIEKAENLELKQKRALLNSSFSDDRFFVGLFF